MARLRANVASSIRTLRRGVDTDRPPRGEDGLGLIEYIIAFLILIMVLLPTSYFLMQLENYAGNATQRTAALGLAEQWVEQLNANGPATQSGTSSIPITTPYNPVPNNNPSTDTGTVQEGPVTYSVIAQFAWTDGGAEPDLCQSSTAPIAMQLTVWVYWGPAAQQLAAMAPNYDPTKVTATADSVATTTVVDWPPPSVPQFGFLAVQVNGSPSSNPPADASGTTWVNRVATVPVTVSGTTSGGTAFNESTVADSFGCAFLEVQPPNSTGYTVQVGADSLFSSPFVGTASAGAPSPTSLTTSGIQVSLDKVTSETYQYDEGSYIQVNQPNSSLAADALSCPSNAGTISCISAGESPYGNAFDGSSGVTAAVNILQTNGAWWSKVLATSLDITHIESSACAVPWCISVGDYVTSTGTTTAAAVFTSSSTAGAYSYQNLPPPSGVTNLSSIKCPTATSCLVLGSTSTGPVVWGATVSTSGITWSLTPDLMPVTTPLLATVTSLKQLSCPTSTSYCWAVGSTSAGTGVVMVGGQSGGVETWAQQTLPTGIASVNQINCPAGGSACLAIGTPTAGSTPVIIAGPQAPGPPSWIGDTPPAGVTGTLTSITCSGTAACFAIGGSNATGAVVIAGPAQDTSAVTWAQDTIAGALTISQITCAGNTGTTACTALFSTSTADGIASGPVLATAQTWTVDTLPTGAVINQVTCPATQTVCIASGSGIWVGALGTGTGAQSYAAPSASSVVPQFVTGVSCVTTPSFTCAATGGSQAGQAFLMEASPPSATVPIPAWTATTISNVVGATGYEAGVNANTPLEIKSTSLSTPVTVCSIGTCFQPQPLPTPYDIGPLYPFQSGYEVGAGDCAAEAVTQVSPLPGANAATAPSMTLSLGLVPIEVVNAAGQPVAGAQVQLVIADTNAANSACNDGTVYTMPYTGTDGTAREAVINETYNVTVVAGGTTYKNVGTLVVTSGTTSYTTPIGGTNTTTEIAPTTQVVTE
jgi:Tfp pilus assembly protein PilV